MKTMFFWPLVLLQIVLLSCSSLKNRAFKTSELTFGSDFQVKVTKYSGETSVLKTLIILPPTGGTNAIDRSYARGFCEKGYDVYILNEWSNMNEKNIDLGLHQRLYAGAQKAITLALNDIKTPYVGLIGTSVGALHGAVAAGYQDKINSVFIITGGATIPEVIINSDQPAMIELKKARYTKYNFKNDDEYREALDRAFQFEPTTMTKHKTKALGMSIANEDTTVPVKNQKKLEAFWNPKVTLHYPNNHFWGIVRTWWSGEEDIFNFFEANAPK